MCGRYTLVEKDFGTIADELAARYEQGLLLAHAPHYNVAPTHVLPVAVVENEVIWLRAMKWGLPGDKLKINLRAEGLARPDMRGMVASGRCVVPADGFYEWRKEGGKKLPLHFHREDGKVFYLAGLFQDEGYAVITTRANETVAAVHDRMPVVLDARGARRWLLDGELGLLKPAVAGLLVVTPVSQRVNDVKNDDPGCLAGAEPDRQLGLI